MAKLEVGTLVAVADAALREGWEHYQVNHEMVDKYGWLYRVCVVPTDEDQELYACQSLSDPKGNGIQWLRSELNEVNTDGSRTRTDAPQAYADGQRAAAVRLAARAPHQDRGVGEMQGTTERNRPAASEKARAAKLLKRYDKMRADMRALERELGKACADYGRSIGIYGYSRDHLRIQLEGENNRKDVA